MLVDFEAGVVEAVSRSHAHGITMHPADAIRLLAGQGVEGDAHLGATVQHRSRVVRDPNHPNLRQIHLIHGELHEELRAQGIDIAPGAMGENVTTRGLILLALPRGSRLHLGSEAVVEVTGLRNPCRQLDGIEPGLMEAVLGIDGHGRRIRKAGIMAVVLRGGVVRPGDAVRAEHPAPPWQRLEPV